MSQELKSLAMPPILHASTSANVRPYFVTATLGTVIKTYEVYAVSAVQAQVLVKSIPAATNVSRGYYKGNSGNYRWIRKQKTGV